MQQQLSALILAAGEGTRMKSDRPKVLHEILGRSLVMWSIESAREAGSDHVSVVVGNQHERVSGHIAQFAADHGYETPSFVVQTERKGTGHAVMCALEASSLPETGSLVILSGDSPLLSASTITTLVETQQNQGAAVSVLTFEASDPTGYGRVICSDQGAVEAIVEHKDCTAEQLKVTTCNSGVYCFDLAHLRAHIGELNCNNSQGEYYLTDMISILKSHGFIVTSFVAPDPQEALGVNSRVQLAEAAQILQVRINEKHMLAGVTMIDPRLVWIGPEVELGRDVELLPLTILMGKTSVGSESVVGPSSRLTDTVVGEGCVIDETVAIGARVDNQVTCGPRAYLRPGAHLCDSSKVGTHVEVKNTEVGPGSKVPHLSYIGDATLGTGVNIGAGTITCNYDGSHKHRTKIGDHVFIGSDTMLVAPVTLGDRSITGAGSTITQDVPEGALALERSDQRTIEDYADKRAQRSK